MNDPAQSGPTFPLIAGVMNEIGKYKSGSTSAAVAKGKSFFEALAKNGLLVSSTNGPTLGAMEIGSINMAVVQSSACYGDELNGSFPSVRVKYLNYSVALPSAIGIDAKAPKIVQQDAEKFADWVMSKPGQHVMQTGDPQGDSLFWPVLNNEQPANKIIRRCRQRTRSASTPTCGARWKPTSTRGSTRPSSPSNSDFIISPAVAPRASKSCHGFEALGLKRGDS